AREQHAMSLVLALAVPVVFFVRDGSAWRLLPLAVAPLALLHVRRLRRADTPEALIALLGETGKLLAIYALLFAAGVVL
ncbi:MAG TPA: 1,4-dihydroxy-2-naphthoate polyprenyltransferase, partial [Opitutus sp.]|nr:1,4-dihydroxy-2-naphthoate polyprenyltransferase [Opitutus sp.]